jgi:hypothetical protein
MVSLRSTIKQGRPPLRLEITTRGMKDIEGTAMLMESTTSLMIMSGEERTEASLD